jgi:hypothetical protein
MHPDQALETIREVERVRKETRRRLSSFWFPLVVFGVLNLLSVPVVWTSFGAAVGLYWVAASAVGFFLIGRHYRRRERDVGLGAAGLPYLLTGWAIIVGSFLVAGLGGSTDHQMVAALGPGFVVAAGYTVFAWLERSFWLAGVALAIGAVSGVLALSDLEPYQAATILANATGWTLLATGLLLRPTQSERT